MIRRHKGSSTPAYTGSVLVYVAASQYIRWRGGAIYKKCSCMILKAIEMQVATYRSVSKKMLVGCCWFAWKYWQLLQGHKFQSYLIQDPSSLEPARAWWSPQSQWESASSCLSWEHYWPSPSQFALSWSQHDLHWYCLDLCFHFWATLHCPPLRQSRDLYTGQSGWK